MAVNDILTGTDTELWVAVEGGYGIPTKAQWKAEYTSGSVSRDLMRIYGRTLRNSPTMRRKEVVGRAVYQGDIELEVTPEGAFPRLMSALFPFTTTNLTSPARYRHRFYNAFGARSVTIIQRKGRSLYVYPGCLVNSFELTTSKEQDSALTARFGIYACDEFVYELDFFSNALTYLGTATASEDPLLPYTPVDATATIGALTASIRSVTVSASKNLGREFVLDGKRGARQAYETRTETGGSANLFFSSMTNIRRDLTGVTTDPSGAYAAGSILATASVSMTFNPANNSSAFSNILTVCFPNAAIKTDEPVSGDAEIPENLTFFPIDAVGDPSGTDFYLEITNSETYSSLWTPNTPITTPPTSSVYLYEYAQASAGVSTTSVPADAVSGVGQWHLANQNASNYYVGRQLRQVSGSNAGTARNITAYSGTPIPTFTVAAFPNAPATGAIFEIV